jgi:hypothetical protein
METQPHAPASSTEPQASDWQQLAAVDPDSEPFCPWSVSS